MKNLEINLGSIPPFNYNNKSSSGEIIVYYSIPYCGQIEFNIDDDNKHFSKGRISAKNGFLIDLLTKQGFNIDLELDESGEISEMSKYGLRGGTDVNFLTAYSFMQRLAQNMLKSILFPTSQIKKKGLEIIAKDIHLELFDKAEKEGRIIDTR